MKILVKYHNPISKIEKHGNWIDLKASETVHLEKWKDVLIPLGVSIKLPKYYQANIVPRSGTFSKYKIIQCNHYGVIDGPDCCSDGYSGNNDIWKFRAFAFEPTTINEGDRICQFEIRPTMTAPWHVKLKWIFDSKINIIETIDLKSKNRGGFGSTGI
jgi:dUTP pyrophosphatase